MKKLFFATVLFFSLMLLCLPFLPNTVSAAEPIVQCDPAAGKACDFNQLKEMLQRILNIIVNQIAAPLAIIAIVVASVLMMTSAGDPNRFGLGKKILYAAIIGLFLALGTKAIIDFILSALKGGA